MSTSTRRPLRAAGLFVAVLLALAPAWPAAAQSSPSYDDLLGRLDQLSGTIQGVALSEAADARVQQARALKNPTLSYDLENAQGTGAYRGTSNADSIITLSQPLELFGQRGARVRAAQSEAQAAGLRSELSRSEVAALLATTYAQAESALRRYDLANEALQLIQEDAAATSAMVQQGREPQLRAVQAQSEVSNAKAALDEALAFRDAALARLAGAAQLDASVDAISESLLDRAPPMPTGDARAALAVRIAEAEAATAGRLVDVERKRALPDLSATVAQTNFRQAGERAYNIGVSLSIPVLMP